MSRYDRVIAKIKKAQNIAIFMHINPDCDCLGSAIALYLYLQKIGKNVSYFSPDLNNDNMIGVFVGVVLFVGGLILFITMSSAIKKEKKKIKEQTEVVINGVSYPKSTFDHMFQDALFQNNKAVAELRRITGISEEEARKILRHWDKYYYY